MLHIVYCALYSAFIKLLNGFIKLSLLIIYQLYVALFMTFIRYTSSGQFPLPPRLHGNPLTRPEQVIFIYYYRSTSIFGFLTFLSSPRYQARRHGEYHWVFSSVLYMPVPGSTKIFGRKSLVTRQEKTLS
jgi:hypothetical protein